MTDKKVQLLNNIIISVISLIIIVVVIFLTGRFLEIYRIEFPKCYLLVKFIILTWLALSFLLFKPSILVPKKLVEDKEYVKFFYNIVMQIIIAGSATLIVVISILWTKQGGTDLEYCVENSILLFLILIYFISVMYYRFLRQLKKEMVKLK